MDGWMIVTFSTSFPIMDDHHFSYIILPMGDCHSLGKEKNQNVLVWPNNKMVLRAQHICTICLLCLLRLVKGKAKP
jgi:hypothetical protein